MKEEKIEWVEVARRGENHNVLLMDLMIRTYLENKCGRTFGEGVQFIPSHYRQFNGARWFSREDYERYIALLRQAVENGRIIAIGKDYERNITETREYAETLKAKKFTEMTNGELISEFKKFCDVEVSHWSHAYHYIFLNRFLPDEVTSEVSGLVPDSRKQNEYLLTLFTSDKPTEMREENIALVRLAEKMSNEKIPLDSPQAHQLVEEHLSKYAHLGRYYYRSNAYSAGQITERLKHLSAEEIGRKKNEFAEQENTPAKTKKIIGELKLPQKTIEKLYAIKQFAFDSNYADETLNYFVQCGTPMLKEICRRLDCAWNELVSMRRTEIIEALERNTAMADEFKKEVRQRFKDHAIILDNGGVTLLSGKALEEYYAQEVKAEKKMDDLKEFKGVSASPGKASGKVAIVMTTKELNKVGKGDILVTSMTTPEFVPAMERAGAIVTDDGGLLCHAAIVSRELNLPCVVGTRVATKALRDGELVEVDAVAGTIKKITG